MIKYVMFENGSGKKFPVIFHQAFAHNKMAEAIRQKYPILNPISAGFLIQDEHNLSSFGNSFSMQMEADSTDAAIIESCLREE